MYKTTDHFEYDFNEYDSKLRWKGVMFSHNEYDDAYDGVYSYSVKIQPTRDGLAFGRCIVEKFKTADERNQFSLAHYGKLMKKHPEISLQFESHQPIVIEILVGNH